MRRITIIDDSDIKGLANALEDAIRKHGVVIYPTDTVMGIGCSVYDEIAVEKLLAAKGRPDTKKGLPVIAEGIDAAMKVAVFDGSAKKLARAFWPGALTMILPVKDKKIDGRVYFNNTIGIRVPESAVARGIARAFDGLVVGTSANVSGRAPVKTYAEALAELPQVDIFVESKNVAQGQPSTIYDLENGRIVREGTISLEEIDTVLKRSD